MVKFVSVNIALGMLLAMALITSAMAADTPPADQSRASASRPAVISGANDQRIITPDMNYRERMETQRNIKKRAAAKRNQLIQAAEKQRKKQAETVGTNAPALE